MHINDLPLEILGSILHEASKFNEANGEVYTYGLSQAPLPLQATKLKKYLRGPISPDSLKWDATHSIRSVCSTWHDWALEYLLRDVFARRWRGSERWAELSLRRPTYSIYELIEDPSGLAVYRDPFATLRNMDELFRRYPGVARHVHRIWFNGFYTAETDRIILSILRSCADLVNASVPWTLLRRGTADQWARLLNVNATDGQPLRSLELQAVSLPSNQDLQESEVRSHPFHDHRVDFGELRRLKFFGNTLSMPVCDADLRLMACTATRLECLDITNLSTVTVAGMMALVKASQQTLRVLEHSPRSDDGFYHPHPGSMPSSEHLCQILNSCPKLRDLSISLPTLCPDLFANHSVLWEGECQIRAAGLCTSHSNLDAPAHQTLQQILASARELVATRHRYHNELAVEIFFAGCIFEPQLELVHGDFSLAAISSGGLWPRDGSSVTSTKGSYGTTGSYGKDEGNWTAVGEKEFLSAVERGWVAL